MNKRVRKAVFPAGGLGTRFLPATKVIPKEMLALVDKPIIQYGVEEAIASGIEHIIIVTGRGKGAIEDHFDHSFELDATLKSRGKHELLAVSRGVSSLARISYVRQKEPLGLGHAVLCAKDLVGDEPFAVMLPDDVIDAEVPCLKQMLAVEGRPCMRGDIDRAQRLSIGRIEGVQLVSSSKPDTPAVIGDPVHALGTRKGSVLTHNLGG